MTLSDTFFLRIAVPVDLHSFLLRKEITRSLHTTDKARAVPLALEFAAALKRAFLEARESMAEGKGDSLREMLIQAKASMAIKELVERHEVERESTHRAHRKEIERTRLEAENKLMRELLSGAPARAEQPPASPVPPTEPASVHKSAPKLKQVIDHFSDSYPRDNAGMLKKLNAVLPLFLEYIGDEPVDQLRQIQIVDFFKMVERLPPQWPYECRKLGVTPLQLAREDHPVTIAKSTFTQTYRTSVSTFLKAAKSNWHDQGFPAGLTTVGIEYGGREKAGQNKQRAWKPEELRLFFEGQRMREYANDPARVHHFWLPVLGLHTGARVNEICQINPQMDIRRDEKTNAWCMTFTEDSEAGEGIEKSVKTDGSSRTIPVHHQLVALGFIEYVNAIKKAGADRLFPAWKPKGGKASPAAVKAFGRMLEEAGLHGVENEAGKALRGMHSFRHTLLTYGMEKGVDLRCISGHKERSDNEVFAGYLDNTILQSLDVKIERLSKLDYGLNIPKPVLPSCLGNWSTLKTLRASRHK